MIRTDEFGQWQPAGSKFGKIHIDAYLKHNKVSPPEEDFDDRLVLYGLCDIQPHLFVYC